MTEKKPTTEKKVDYKRESLQVTHCRMSAGKERERERSPTMPHLLEGGEQLSTNNDGW